MPPDTPDFAAARGRLDDAAGRRVSDFRLACLLGVSPERVARLSGGAAARPSLVLATLYAARVGYARADETAGDETAIPPGEIARVTSLLPFDAAHVAMLLGLSASRFARMRSATARQVTPRHYLLALLELAERYGPGSQYHADVERARVWRGVRPPAGRAGTPGSRRRQHTM